MFAMLWIYLPSMEPHQKCGTEDNRHCQSWNVSFSAHDEDNNVKWNRYTWKSICKLCLSHFVHFNSIGLNFIWFPLNTIWIERPILSEAFICKIIDESSHWTIEINVAHFPVFVRICKGNKYAPFTYAVCIIQTFIEISINVNVGLFFLMHTIEPLIIISWCWRCTHLSVAKKLNQQFRLAMFTYFGLLRLHTLKYNHKTLIPVHWVHKLSKRHPVCCVNCCVSRISRKTTDFQKSFILWMRFFEIQTHRLQWNWNCVAPMRAPSQFHWKFKFGCVFSPFGMDSSSSIGRVME